MSEVDNLAKEHYINQTKNSIPNGWQIVKLGDVFKLKSGDGISKDKAVIGNNPVYGGNGIAFYHNEFNYENSKLIIGRVGAKCGCIHITKAKSWITDNALILSYYLRAVDNIFIFYLLNDLDLNRYANKNAQPVISGGKIYPIKISLPPLPEQQKIAEILSTVDEKIEVIDEKIKQTQELKKGLMQRLLTKGIGHTKFKDSPLGEIPESWDVVQFEKLLSQNSKNPLSYGILQPSDGVENGIKMLRTVDLKENGLSGTKILEVPKEISDTSTKTLLDGGEILLSVMGTLGRTFVVPNSWKGWNVNRALAVIRTNDLINNHFLCQYFRSGTFKKIIEKQSLGSAQMRINLNDLRKYPVPLPTVDEQQNIVEILTLSDEKIGSLQSKRQTFQELKKGLMQKLLTGKIRVEI